MSWNWWCLSWLVIRNNRQVRSFFPDSRQPSIVISRSSNSAAWDRSLFSGAMWCIPPHSTAYHRMLPHTTACYRIPPHATAFYRIPPHATAYHRMLPHATAYHRMVAHGGAYIRGHSPESPWREGFTLRKSPHLQRKERTLTLCWLGSDKFM